MRCKLILAGVFFATVAFPTAVLAACDENHGMSNTKCQRDANQCETNSYDSYEFHNNLIKLESRVEKYSNGTRKRYMYCVENTDSDWVAYVEWRQRDHGGKFYYHGEIDPNQEGVKITSKSAKPLDDDREFMQQRKDGTDQNTHNPDTLYYDKMSSDENMDDHLLQNVAFAPKSPDNVRNFLSRFGREGLVDDDGLVFEEKIIQDPDVLTPYLEEFGQIEEWSYYNFYMHSPLSGADQSGRNTTIAMEVFVSSTVSVGENGHPVSRLQVAAGPSPVRYEGAEKVQWTIENLKEVPMHIRVEFVETREPVPIMLPDGSVVKDRKELLRVAANPKGTVIVSELGNQDSFEVREVEVGLTLEGEDEVFGDITQDIFVAPR